MKIKFDYSFDRNGFFNSYERRAALEKAGEIWSSLINDDFEAIPEGVEFTIQNPTNGDSETIILEEEIDDIIIYVGANTSPYGGSSDGQPLINNHGCHLTGCACSKCSVSNKNTINLSQRGVLDSDNSKILGKAQIDGIDLEGDIFQRRISDNFRERGVVTDFEPWAGTISFNSEIDWDFSLDNPNLEKIDFISVALHEIGHVLGIGTAPIFDSIGAGRTFDGVNALAVNNGDPIPLEADLGHIQDGFQGNSVLLDPTKNIGRNLPSNIDLAILADIGYEIDGFTTQGSIPALATSEEELIFGSIINDNIDGLLGDDRIQGGLGEDTLFGSGGSDILFGQGDGDLIFGGRGEDELQGGASDDTLQGDAGNDTVFGQQGNDRLFGNDNHDQLQGGLGEDTLFGGEGNDLMRGGDDRDYFWFEANNGQDVINEFIVAEDTIVLAASLGFNNGAELLDAITNTGLSSTGGLFSQITLSPENTISIFHDNSLTAENFAIDVPLQVTDLQTTASGFVLEFNRSIDLEQFNLYGSNAADLRLVSQTTGELVRGSAIWDEGNNSLTFVKTEGILATDRYELTIFSRQDGLVTELGTLLDGNGDGNFGDNFTRTLNIDNSNRRVLSIDDFSHAPGQKIDFPTQERDLAINLDNGAGVTKIDFDLTFDRDILGVNDILVNRDLAGWQLTQKNFETPGRVSISLEGETALNREDVELVFIDAEVADTAVYGRSGLVKIESIRLNNGNIAAVGDTGVGQVAYKGDVSGNGRYSSLDASLIAHTSVGINSGFDAYSAIDPLIIGDVNNDGNITAVDASLVTI
ncbi:MAG: hypothetical protein AB4368_15695 [Xenococcaceae cyanobacterium]